MTNEATGPFNGLFRNLENMRLAEIWITEVGVDHEFKRQEFIDGTGINPNSVGRVLNMLVEKGILGCYSNPRDSRTMLYRVAWPVKVTRPKPVQADDIPDVAQTDYPEESTPEVYHVRLFMGDQELTLVTVEAMSPIEAAQLARERIKAHVSQEWIF